MGGLAGKGIFTLFILGLAAATACAISLVLCARERVSDNEAALYVTVPSPAREFGNMTSGNGRVALPTLEDGRVLRGGAVARAVARSAEAAAGSAPADWAG